MATNKFSIINNELFMYELDPFVIENVPSNVTVIYVQEEKFDEYKQLNPTLPLAKKNYLLMGINQPVWYEDYQRVMELPEISSPELSFSESEVEVNVYEVPCIVSLQVVNNTHNVDVVYSVDGVEVLDPSACEITDGSHTVTASFAGSELYYAASVSYALTINIVEDTMDISFTNNSVSVSSYLDETWTGQLQPVTGAPQGATIVYSCEDGVIANGELTLPSAGTYTVTVTVSAVHYTTATASYTIVYTQDYRTMNISFAVDSVGVTGNQKEAYTGTVQSVTGAPQGATIVYSCSDANVTISGTSIEIADEGTYTITATVSANYYNTATASYSIVYSQNDLVMNLSFANSAISETLTEGDGYEAQVQSVTGAPQDSTIVYSTSAGSISNDTLAISNISDGDVVTVSATVSCPDYVTTTISYTISFTVFGIMDAYFANNSVLVSSYVDENYTGALQAVTGAPQGSTVTYYVNTYPEIEHVTIENGQVSIDAAGTYTIYASVSCTGYVTKTISYSIVYTQSNRTMSLSFANSSVDVSTYVDETYSGTVQSVTGAPSGATIVYSCSDSDVTISGTSIDIASAGTYTITATVSATGYTTATASYTIVYTQNNRTMSLSFTNSAISETISGDSYSAQVQAVTGAPQGATVVYTTSDGSISNGTLTVSSISDNDVVTVTATVSATGYTTATASYTITFTVLSQKSNLNVSFAQNEYNYSPHGVDSVEPIIGIPNDYDGTITWEYSSDGGVTWNTVLNDLIGDIEVEEVYVRATLPDTSLYNGTQIQYTVTRWTDWSAIAWEGTGITSTTFYFDSEDNPSFPVSVTPIDAPTTNGVSVDSITSSDTSILEIDSNTGEWILKQEGTVTMTATVNDVIQSDYRMCGDTKDLTVTIDIVSGRVETQFMQSSASDVNKIEYVESDLTQSQLPYTITISDVYLQTTQGTAVTLSDSSLIVHDCGPDFSFDNDNNKVTYTAWQLSDMVQATLTFKGDATYKPCSATVYIELNEAIQPEKISPNLSFTESTKSEAANWQGSYWQNPGFAASLNNPNNVPVTFSVEIENQLSGDSVNVNTNNNNWVSMQINSSRQQGSTMNFTIYCSYDGSNSDTYTSQTVSMSVSVFLNYEFNSDIHFDEVSPRQVTTGTNETYSGYYPNIVGTIPSGTTITYQYWNGSQTIENQTGLITLPSAGNYNVLAYLTKEHYHYKQLNFRIEYTKQEPQPQGMEVTIFLDDENSPGMPMSYKEVSYDSDMQGFPYTPADEYMILKDGNGDEIDSTNNESMSLYEYVSTYVGDENGENETKYDPNDDNMTLSAGTYTIRKTIDQVNGSYAWTGFNIASVEDGVYTLVVTIHQIEE